MDEIKEKDIETYLCSCINRLGGVPYKFTSPARRSVPDRLCVMPSGISVFVECKRPGKKLSQAQTREAARLKALGQWVTWVDSKDAVDGLMIQIKKEIFHARQSNQDR